MTDTESLTEHLQISRTRQFEALYTNTFPSVAKIVSRQGGSFQDAKDIFQDALVIYYEKTSDEQTTGKLLSPQAYLVGIAKHLWIKKYKDDKRMLLTEYEQAIEIPADDEKEKNNLLLTLLESTGKKCLDLLHAFYYDQLSLNTISSAFGFANNHSAAAQKYKCIEKIRNTIKDKSIRYEDFVE